MPLKKYFEENKGFGVLSTADGNGDVNAAVFARPHIMEEGTAAFIMPDHRRTYKNLSENPSAAYLFREEADGYHGKRLYLKKVKENDDPDFIAKLRRRPRDKSDSYYEGKSVCVIFEIEQEMPLTGKG